MTSILFFLAFLIFSMDVRAESSPVSTFTAVSGASAVPTSASLPPLSVDVSTETEQAPVSPEPEFLIRRPKWLIKAEKYYEEGMKAQEAGDARLAAAKYSDALGLLSRKAEAEALTEIKVEIAAVFSRLEEHYVPPLETPIAPSHGLAISEKELQDAPTIQMRTPLKKKSFVIPVDANLPLVQKYISIYTGPRRAHMQEAMDRMMLYKDMILKELSSAGLPSELLYLPLVESEFINSALSRAGALGLWQFMSSTGRFAGLRINYWVDDRLDPDKATKAAARVLKDLFNWFEDWHLALAAYNRGLYGIQRDMEFTRSPDYALLSKRQALPGETEHYVPKFMACVLIAENAEAYGFKLNNGAKKPAVDEVLLTKPLDLKVAAQCAGTTEKVLRGLNPTLRLWCTPKNDPHFLFKIPAGTKESFLAALAQVKDWTPSSDAVRYRVRKGDNLGKIALRYKTTVDAIQKDNRLRTAKYLMPGQTLVIRPGRRFRGEE